MAKKLLIAIGVFLFAGLFTIQHNIVVAFILFVIGFILAVIYLIKILTWTRNN